MLLLLLLYLSMRSWRPLVQAFFFFHLHPSLWLQSLSSGPPSIPPPPLPPGFNNGGDAFSPSWDQTPVTSAWDHPASTPASATSPPWNSGWQAQQNSYPQVSWSFETPLPSATLLL